jgi:hypothetical protein
MERALGAGSGERGAGSKEARVDGLGFGSMINFAREGAPIAGRTYGTR